MKNTFNIFNTGGSPKALHQEISGIHLRQDQMASWDRRPVATLLPQHRFEELLQNQKISSRFCSNRFCNLKIHENPESFPSFHIVSIHNLDQYRSRSSSGSCLSYLLRLCGMWRISIGKIDSVVDVHKQSIAKHKKWLKSRALCSARLCKTPQTPADALVPLWCVGTRERNGHSSASFPRWHSARRCTTSAPWPCTSVHSIHHNFELIQIATLNKHWINMLEVTPIIIYNPMIAFRLCVRMCSACVPMCSWFIDLHSNIATANRCPTSLLPAVELRLDVLPLSGWSPGRPWKTSGWQWEPIRGRKPSKMIKNDG